MPLRRGEVRDADLVEELYGDAPAQDACGLAGGDAQHLESFEGVGVAWGVVDRWVLQVVFECGDLMLDGLGLCGAGEEVGDGGVVGADRDLAEVPKAQDAVGPEVAATGSFVAEQDAKQRGFAAAVGPEESDAVLGMYFEGGVIEEEFAFVAFGEAAGFDEDVHSGGGNKGGSITIFGGYPLFF